MISKVKAIFFDADGTLYDSNKLHYLAHKIAAKELYAVDLKWGDYSKEVLKTSKSGLDFLRELGADVNSVEFYALKDRLYVDMVQSKLKPMDGLKDFLRWCNKKRIRRFIVSSAKLVSVEASLTALGMNDDFEGIVAREHSGDLQKPHHFPYKRGLQMAQLSAEQAVAIEDTAEGIVSAKQAGLMCIGFKHKTNLLKDLSGADHIITSYSELMNFWS